MHQNLLSIYKGVYLWDIMTNDSGLYVKLPKELKAHSTEYAKKRGGLSKMVRDLLTKETKFKSNNSRT